MELKNVFDNGIFDSRNGLTEDMAKARAASGFGNYVKNKTSKMKKKNKIRILRFIISFFVIAILFVIPLHFFGIKGMEPQSWSEIFSNWWVILPVGIFGAIAFTFDVDDELPFLEKFKKKGKSE